MDENEKMIVAAAADKFYSAKGGRMAIWTAGDLVRFGDLLLAEIRAASNAAGPQPEQTPAPAAEKAATKEVIYIHDHWDDSRRRKYNFWQKVIAGIDPAKNNGYAFLGKFLPYDREQVLREGNIVVEHAGDNYTAYRVVGDREKAVIARANWRSMVEFIRTVADELRERGSLPVLEIRKWNKETSSWDKKAAK